VLVLDANILMRAVSGRRVRTIIARYADSVELIASGSAFDEAAQRRPEVIRSRSMESRPTLSSFAFLATLVGTIAFETYRPFEVIARHRLARRDEDDWPVLAATLALRRLIRTEDLDVFGCVATSTDRVQLYPSSEPSPGSTAYSARTGRPRAASTRSTSAGRMRVASYSTVMASSAGATVTLRMP
jgi:predicted nucleic acid-binding protein